MITQIPLWMSNAYLIKGDRPILVDTGSANEEKKILQALEKENVSVDELTLIIHTHGHADHVSSTVALKKLCDAPTLIHKADSDMVREGHNGKLVPIGFTAKFATRFSNWAFKPFTADIIIEEEMRLDSYGVPGQIVFTPGHTHGSISVILDSGEAIIGDLIIGGYMGSLLFPCRPVYPYFGYIKTIDASLKKVMSFSPKILYSGHGGPFTAQAITGFG
ncbi:MAG: hypothetical protein B6242_08230 [Anaerolineaceae bacterium 4572_78]|nr:MAG: hypothetical protein B6242_08230 [Anaerolineaceae bacterium 4572_78]